MILKINLTNIDGKQELIILNNVLYFDEIITSKANTLVVFNGVRAVSVVETIKEIDEYIDKAVNDMSKLFTPDINISNNIKGSSNAKQAKSGVKTDKVETGKSSK